MQSAIIRTLLILTLLPHPHAALASNSYPVGVARVGAGEGEAQDKLQKRIFRFLENDKSLSLKALELGSAERALDSLNLRVRALEASIEALRKGQDTNAVIDSSIEALDAFRDLSPMFQKARSIQALQAWKEGKTEDARKRLSQALTYHPEGRLQENVSFTGLDGKSKADWEQFIQDVSETTTRGCWFDLEVLPSSAEVSVNGFAFGGRRSFQLVRGRAYEALIQSEGFGAKELAMDCRRAGQWLETVRLERGGADNRTVSRLNRLSREHDLASVVFAMPISKEVFGLFLYTRGVGVDTIPTSSPLRLSSLSQDSTDENLPLASEALTDVLEKHRAAPLRASLAQSGESGYAVSRQQLPVPTPWYERTEFWWLAGLAAAGVSAALVFGNQSPRQVHSNPTLKGRVN